ncbi:hypothetical protein [Myroides odoratus]|uniref:Uncharacterized protein n=1 Tax=Myroides odoratus TaxID=256 RepID=A0A9Q6Z2N3_MYROD|nr:hypothetical protein [Myroides odoratus]EHQ41403.1 hypothetical protein Myrod_0567 [Myroides odoratus DSM 2801]EKB08726.1 hypothetical protein HMPREF9716_00777 [Myroides odoratus CIP 103059]QQT98837.1 hypothetical protein I6I88_11485 [Myroides odoratus]WQD58979.1 hypothetical protein U0010_07495 [Myroides odoratus]STZ32442.1 Uncharacterised protein [Myroides odoratus]
MKDGNEYQLPNGGGMVILYLGIWVNGTMQDVYEIMAPYIPMSRYGIQGAGG